MQQKADAVIIGGGIVGTSIACHLAGGGLKDLVLLEKEPLLGTGSSGASAGVIYHHLPEKVNLQLSRSSLQAVLDFEREFEATLEFRQSGCIQTAGSPEDLTVLEGIHEDLCRMGVESRLLPPEILTDFFPDIEVNDLLSAIYTPGDGYFDPHGMIQGYAARARRLGTRMLMHTPATGLKMSGDRIIGVETPQGTIETEIAVNAAGPAAAEIAGLAGIPNLPVVPFKRQIFFTGPTDLVPPGSPFYFDRTPPFYFRPESGALIMSIAEMEERRWRDTSLDWKSAPILAERASRRLPGLDTLQIVRGWAGLRSMTPDHTAILGPAPGVSGFYLAVGFSGHGVMHAPMTGKIIASMIVDRNFERYEDIDLAPLKPGRFLN